LIHFNIVLNLRVTSIPKAHYWLFDIDPHWFLYKHYIHYSNYDSSLSTLLV